MLSGITLHSATPVLPTASQGGATATDAPHETPAAPHSSQHTDQTKTSNQLALGAEEIKQVAELKARDREVRAHEAAHMAAAGGLARGGASFSYQQGPDGRHYAVGGEVSIDTAAVAGDPQATIIKAQTIRAAALAPAQPSSQDRAVAAAAAQMEAAARAELMAANREQSTPAGDPQAGLEAYRQHSNPVAAETQTGSVLHIET